MSGAHGHVEGDNKKIALHISVLALFLALAETMAKGAQTNALSYNVEASNLWAFFQAKTVRQTVVRTAGEMADFERARNPEPAPGRCHRQADRWLGQDGRALGVRARHGRGPQGAERAGQSGRGQAGHGAR